MTGESVQCVQYADLDADYIPELVVHTVRGVRVFQVSNFPPKINLERLEMSKCYLAHRGRCSLEGFSTIQKWFYPSQYLKRKSKLTQESTNLEIKEKSGLFFENILKVGKFP